MLEAPCSQSPRAPSFALCGGAVKCGSCAKSFDFREWLALPVVDVLSKEAIAAHVVRWPRGVRIQIRRCDRCGRSIARTEV